jgi:hypothetical protein
MTPATTAVPRPASTAPRLSLAAAHKLAKRMSRLAKQRNVPDQYRASLDADAYAVIEARRAGARTWRVVQWADDVTERDGHVYGLHEEIIL